MTQKKSEPTVVWWNGQHGWATYRGHSMPLTEPPKFSTVAHLTWLAYWPHSDGPHDLADADCAPRPMTAVEIAEIEARCRRMKDRGLEGWLSEVPPPKEADKKKKTCP